MGKIKQGILGGFNGTVGTVIGASWKGISYMRGKAQSIKNPNTQPQKSQRSKFAMVMAFLQQIKPFIDLGFKSQANKQSAFNAAMSYILKNGIVGSAPNYGINYSGILLSQGSLAPAKEFMAALGTNKVIFNWLDSSLSSEGSASDKAMLLVYNSTKEEAIVNLTSAVRSDETVEVAIPSAWSGDALEAYIAFASADGSVVSDSVHNEIAAEGPSLQAEIPPRHDDLPHYDNPEGEEEPENP